MWKFVEQQSFHLTEEQYMMQLDAVADYLNDWGVVDTYVQFAFFVMHPYHEYYPENMPYYQRILSFGS